MDLSGEQVQHIVETLSNGNADDVGDLIYGNHALTETQRKIPLGLLEKLRAPNVELVVSVAEAGYQEPFWLLILNVPWLNSDRAGSFHPLLLAHEDAIPKVAGFVLPWNEIIPMFTQEQMAAAQRLTVWWATWLQKQQESNTD